MQFYLCIRKRSLSRIDIAVILQEQCGELISKFTLSVILLLVGAVPRPASKEQKSCFSGPCCHQEKPNRILVRSTVSCLHALFAAFTRWTPDTLSMVLAGRIPCPRHSQPTGYAQICYYSNYKQFGCRQTVHGHAWLADSASACCF